MFPSGKKTKKRMNRHNGTPLCHPSRNARRQRGLQKAVFHNAKDGLLDGKRWPFAMQKATFQETAGT